MMPDGAHALTLLLLAAFGPASSAEATDPRVPAVHAQELTGTVERVDRIDRTVRIGSGAGSAHTTFVEVTDRTRLLGPTGSVALDDFAVGDTVRVVLERPAWGSVARSIELVSRRRE